MLKLLAVVFAGVVAVSSPSFAAQNQSLIETDALATPNPLMWHCTAFPKHGHTHGFTAKDHHRHNAHNRAQHKCQVATSHHCNDVRCHQH